jgi:hypothetical protein
VDDSAAMPDDLESLAAADETDWLGERESVLLYRAAG